MSEIGVPGLTRSVELNDGRKSSADQLLENPFVNALVHTLVQSPLEAAAQVSDKVSSTNFLPKVKLLPEAKQTEFRSWDWLQQQAGSALGALPYLLLLHKASRSALSQKMLTADTRLMLDAGVKLGPAGAQQLVRLELASAGLTGAAYGGLLTPVRVESRQDLSDLLKAKLTNSAVSAGSLMTLSASMMGTKTLASGMKEGAVKTLLSSDVGAGALAGMPAGLFSAQTDSLISGKGFAGLKASSESMLGFAVIGGIMPVGSRGLKTLSEHLSLPKPASDFTPIETVSSRAAFQLKNPGEAPPVMPIDKVFSAEQLNTIRGWKELQSKIPETRLRETEPELISKLADETYGDGAAVKERKLHILLGNCGAGKSRITDALARELGAMTPDSDKIKVRLPGYENGLGNQAVHEDSSASYKLLLDRALANGDNIVWQGVGKTASSVVKLSEQAKTNGYQVVLHMVDAPPEISALRVFNRAALPPNPQTGLRQMIPPEVPLDPRYQYVPRQNFFKLFGESASGLQTNGTPIIDGFRLWRSTEVHHQLLPAPSLPASIDRPSPFAVNFAEQTSPGSAEDLKKTRQQFVVEAKR